MGSLEVNKLNSKVLNFLAASSVNVVLLRQQTLMDSKSTFIYKPVLKYIVV